MDEQSVGPMSREEMAVIVRQEIKESGGMEETLIDISWSHLQLLREVRELASLLNLLA